MYLNDTVKVEEILNSLESLKKSIKSPKAIFTYQLNSPIKNSGFVQARGVDLSVVDTKCFLKSIEAASNWEVFSHTDNSVEINIMFYDVLVEEIEDE